MPRTIAMTSAMTPAMVSALMLAAVIGSNPVAAAGLPVPGGSFESVIPPAEGETVAEVAPFRLAEVPVTNADFLAFLEEHPRWRRDRIASLFADDQYLAHWEAPMRLGAGVREDQPVTGVSWHAARAYCQAQGGRLPTWYEWEFAAAASETRADARDDPQWRQKILDWYSVRGDRALSPVGKTPPNLYGVRDLHGVIWEWVEDFNALLVSGDNREQGGADRLQFCGAGAVAVEDRENYAILMRTAYLSSLDAGFTTRNLGFRCAWPLETDARQDGEKP